KKNSEQGPKPKEAPSIEEFKGKPTPPDLSTKQSVEPEARTNDRIRSLSTSRQQGQVISGKVVDASGHPVSGAEVTLGAQRTRTDGAGSFNFQAQSPVGNLSISAPSFGAQTMAIEAGK